MTPQFAARLTIHEPDIAGTAAGEGLLRAPLLVPVPAPLREARPELDGAGHPELDDAGLPALWRREALHRRLLGLFDVAAATLILFLVLGLTADEYAAAAAMAGMPFLVVLFKVAGLYDRDELRLVHSTLDEVPLLLQLTGLFTLVVIIVESVAATEAIAGPQIVALWLGTFATILIGRTLARSLAGRIAPSERCLVIGDSELAEHIRERLGSSAARATVVASLPVTGENLRTLETPESLRHVVSELQVHRIILAPTTTDTSDVAE